LQSPVHQTLPSVAVLAAAGPVKDNAVLFTNNGWLISGPSILSAFGGGPHGIKVARLINDFVGLGYGVLTVGDDETVTLNEGTPEPGAPIVCVGAGTGLGECYLTSSNGNPDTYECFASEGGHAEFAPRTEGEIELLRWLKVKFKQKHRVR
jgi:glucokinase